MAANKVLFLVTGTVALSKTVHLNDVRPVWASSTEYAIDLWVVYWSNRGATIINGTVGATEAIGEPE